MLSMVSNASLIFLALSFLLFSVLASWNLFKAVESSCSKIRKLTRILLLAVMNRPGFPGECFICELRLPDQYFRWKHNKLFLLLPEEYGPAFPAIVDCYTSPPTLVWPVPLLSGFSNSYGVLPPLCKDH